MAAPLCRLCSAELTHTFVDLGMSPPCETYLAADQLALAPPGAEVQATKDTSPRAGEAVLHERRRVNACLPSHIGIEGPREETSIVPSRVRKELEDAGQLCRPEKHRFPPLRLATPAS